MDPGRSQGCPRWFVRAPMYSLGFQVFEKVSFMDTLIIRRIKGAPYGCLAGPEGVYGSQSGFFPLETGVLVKILHSIPFVNPESFF